MKVSDLVTKLEFLKQTKGDQEVEIMTSMPSVGFSSAVGIRTVVGGIDFDNGRVFIIPEKNLMREEQ